MQWTPITLECYARGGKCEGCYWYGWHKNRPYGPCRIKKEVLKLVDKFGPPLEHKPLTISEVKALAVCKRLGTFTHSDLAVEMKRLFKTRTTYNLLMSLKRKTYHIIKLESRVVINGYSSCQYKYVETVGKVGIEYKKK